MKISIHNLTKGHFDLDVREFDTIKDVKTQIRLLKNIPVAQQTLLLNGNKLEDDSKVLEEYNIYDKASLVLRLSGDIKISIEFINDFTIFLEVNGSDTVWNLKQMIQDKTKAPVYRQHLFLNGDELNDPDKTIVDYKIQDGSCLLVRDEMHVKINFVGGKKIIVETRKADNIEYIKQQIKMMENIPFRQQCLSFNGTILVNHKRVCDYEIENGSTLDMFYDPNYVPSNDYIKIIIVDQDRNEVNFRVKPSIEFSKIMLAFQNLYNIPYRQQRFYYSGCPVSDDDTPAHLEMVDGDVVEVYQCQCGC